MSRPSGGWVSGYPLGKTTPSTIITVASVNQCYCAIDADGNLWVANFSGPNVTEYLKGSKSPHAVITKGVLYPLGIAIRSFRQSVCRKLQYLLPNTASKMWWFTLRKQSPSRTINKTALPSPRGLAVDSNRTLYVANLYQNNVEEYRSGKDDPFQTIEAMDHPTRRDR